MTSTALFPDKRDEGTYDQKTVQIKNAQTGSTRPKSYIAPNTPTEEKIAKIWTELLGVEKISIDDDLFGLGGSSIVALQILARVYELFQVELSMDIIFTASFTIAQLSQLVDDQVIMQADQDELAAILRELDGLSDDEVKSLLEESDEESENDTNV